MQLLLSLGIYLGLTAFANAQLTIEITKGVEGASPIAVVPFRSVMPLAPEQDIGAIISADLARSGRFDPISAQSYAERPGSLSETDYALWRSLSIDHLVVGQINPNGADLNVRFQLAEVFQGEQILGFSFDIRSNEIRRLAHHISDLIYERLTGERGAFGTRVAYISSNRGEFTLSVADADGYNPQTVLRSGQPLMSPAWAPDGNRLAYVSFENRRAQIVVQDVYSGNRQIVSSAPGINGAPAWSPDGRQLAFTLSKDGNPEIYIYNLGTQNLQRVTSNTAIDTEATWAPDGQSLVFTSDRGGSPQLYRLNLSGGQPQRLTFEGDYNARASFSPDGRYLAMVHRRGGRFHIAVTDLQNRSVRVLTDGGLDESPSFAPNGRLIMYATTEGGRGVLAAVSVDGRVQQRLVLAAGDVREPSWSPYTR
jgi:TolB protein